MTTKRTLLVTGASGHLGRRVVELLLERGTDTIVAATRNPEKLADLAGRGVLVRKADFDAPGSLTDAFVGVDRLLLVSTDSLDEPGKRLRQHKHAIDAAAKVGVKHIVYTSLINPVDSPISIAPDHRDTEKALAATQLGFTILRNNMYSELLLQSLPSAVAGGKLFAAAGEGAVGYVTREDCARTAAAALSANSNLRTTIDVTGPSTVTHKELARIASELTQRNIEYIALDAPSLRTALAGHGLPPPVVELLVSFDTAIAQGKLAVASQAVQDLTGQKPTSVVEFLTKHRAALTAQ